MSFNLPFMVCRRYICGAEPNISSVGHPARAPKLDQCRPMHCSICVLQQCWASDLHCLLLHDRSSGPVFFQPCKDQPLDPHSFASPSGILYVHSPQQPMAGQHAPARNATIKLLTNDQPTNDHCIQQLPDRNPSTRMELISIIDQRQPWAY